MLTTNTLCSLHYNPFAVMSAAHELQSKYDLGYQIGEKDGYYRGYYTGHTDAYESGYHAGSRDGYERGFLPGLYVGMFTSAVLVLLGHGVVWAFDKK